MSLEKDLEHVLRRERPPAGFAARVMRRVEEEERGRQRHSSRGYGSWWRAAAAMLLLTIAGGGWLTHYEIERHEGERAKAQVLLALRITGAKMHAAREQVRELGSRSSEAPENISDEKR
jgi:hypothetical protein